VIKGKHHSVNISAWVEFSIQSDGAVEIALPSAPSELSIEPYDITPAQVASGMYSAAHGILVQETPGDITLIDKKNRPRRSGTQPLPGRRDGPTLSIC